LRPVALAELALPAAARQLRGGLIKALDGKFAQNRAVAASAARRAGEVNYARSRRRSVAYRLYYALKADLFSRSGSGWNFRTDEPSASRPSWSCFYTAVARDAARRGARLVLGVPVV